MLSLESQRTSRKPSLTPMIDVVFLLLVFFMLASRFGQDMSVPLMLGGSGQSYSGPPRLVDIYTDTLRLNGVELELPQIAQQLDDLTKDPTDVVILRAREDTTMQRTVEVMEALGSAGFPALTLVDMP
ncbi:ExbD/TolR family protein [Shimia sp.]|uniref:ExbD/TolR family protein n=1 Tax=Shimia sp. TaxID=1954381 RepID=UPI003BA871CF